MLGADFALDLALAIRAIGGHPAVHRNSQPWNMGWKRLSWTDAKYLRHGITMDAWMGIRKIVPVPSCAMTHATLILRSLGTSSQHKKKQVDVIIDMRAAMTAGCGFWLGEQGAIMCPET
eukprot:5103232-Pyramimonas_sp.AAC.1